jgi:hypothetical protein
MSSTNLSDEEIREFGEMEAVVKSTEETLANPVTSIMPFVQKRVGQLREQALARRVELLKKAGLNG